MDQGAHPVRLDAHAPAAQIVENRHDRERDENRGERHRRDEAGMLETERAHG